MSKTKKVIGAPPGRKRAYTDFSEYFRESMRDPEARRIYREVLEEEFRELLLALGLEGDLSLPLRELARLAQAKGLSLKLEFLRGGRVVARYGLFPDEPLEG